MTVPYALIAHWLGPEFPSLLGSLIGLLIVIPAAKAGFLLPKGDPWDFADSSEWDESWNGSTKIELEEPKQKLPLWLAWTPYLLIAVLLVTTRLPVFGIGEWLKSFKLPLNPETTKNVFDSGIDIAEVEMLYLPGTVFIVTCLATIGLHRMSGAAVGRAVKRSSRMIVSASVALLFAVPMVQVFINSSGGGAGLESMPRTLAQGVASVAGGAWPAFSPMIGGVGAFVAGSNTISNMMFSLFQFSVAEQIGVNPVWVVALQAVGGAAGNVICVHNVVAACAVVGLVGREGDVIRITVLVFLYYITVAAILGMILT
jgi:lactate permease